ncbi:hypothetical protein FA15DRAFT_661675 [Coprinopsis marcescibilis]|uniref:(2E,6E)-farnesyl diphosphate synthase n=1 Tax=Coprinopsis marcescibilis TaxID=230819 RepID=A0A5C3KBW2_COPMA|nr:hypothetical protein FA15DRAFT_661675 [Coprinopsis marcescibilis]
MNPAALSLLTGPEALDLLSQGQPSQRDQVLDLFSVYTLQELLKEHPGWRFEIEAHMEMRVLMWLKHCYFINEPMDWLKELSTNNAVIGGLAALEVAFPLFPLYHDPNIPLDIFATADNLHDVAALITKNGYKSIDINTSFVPRGVNRLAVYQKPSPASIPEIRLLQSANSVSFQPLFHSFTSAEVITISWRGITSFYPHLTASRVALINDRHPSRHPGSEQAVRREDHCRLYQGFLETMGFTWTLRNLSHWDTFAIGCTFPDFLPSKKKLLHSSNFLTMQALETLLLSEANALSELQQTREVITFSSRTLEEARQELEKSDACMRGVRTKKHKSAVTLLNKAKRDLTKKENALKKIQESIRAAGGQPSEVPASGEAPQATHKNAPPVPLLKDNEQPVVPQAPISISTQTQDVNMGQDVEEGASVRGEFATWGFHPPMTYPANTYATAKLAGRTEGAPPAQPSASQPPVDQDAPGTPPAQPSTSQAPDEDVNMDVVEGTQPAPTQQPNIVRFAEKPLGRTNDSAMAPEHGNPDAIETMAFASGKSICSTLTLVSELLQPTPLGFRTDGHLSTAPLNQVPGSRHHLSQQSSAPTIPDFSTMYRMPQNPQSPGSNGSPGKRLYGLVLGHASGRSPQQPVREKPTMQKPFQYDPSFTEPFQAGPSSSSSSSMAPVPLAANTPDICGTLPLHHPEDDGDFFGPTLLPTLEPLAPIPPAPASLPIPSAGVAQKKSSKPSSSSPANTTKPKKFQGKTPRKTAEAVAESRDNARKKLLKRMVTGRIAYKNCLSKGLPLPTNVRSHARLHQEFVGDLGTTSRSITMQVFILESNITKCHYHRRIDREVKDPSNKPPSTRIASTKQQNYKVTGRPSRRLNICAYNPSNPEPKNLPINQISLDTVYSFYRKAGDGPDPPGYKEKIKAMKAKRGKKAKKGISPATDEEDEDSDVDANSADKSDSGNIETRPYDPKEIYYLHCGCNLEEVLLDFFIWKRMGKLYSPTKNIYENMGAPWSPRVCQGICNFIWSLGIVVDDLYLYDNEGKRRGKDNVDAFFAAIQKISSLSRSTAPLRDPNTTVPPPPPPGSRRLDYVNIEEGPDSDFDCSDLSGSEDGEFEYESDSHLD